MKNSSRRSFIKTTACSSVGVLFGNSLLASSFPTKKSNHPIHAFTKCLQFLNFEEMADLLARNEFYGADLTVRPKGQILPENVKKDLTKAFTVLRKAGLRTNMIVTSITDAKHPDTKAILKTMADIGIRHYRMGYLKYNPKKTIPENLDEHKRTFEKLEKLNRVYGVTANYQNHSGSGVGGPVLDLYSLLKNCDPKYIGVQYDIRHATVEGALSWPVGLKLLAPWVQTIDIKDFVWHKTSNNNWEIKNVPLGEGMVDFDKYFEMYAALKLNGPISIHYEYDLGGAEHGKPKTSMPQSTIETFMKKDLDFLKNKLEKYNLS